MKNRIKLTLSLLLILCITAVIMLSGCGSTEITDAYIRNSDLPRTSYVEGQDLDLSKGYLTLIRGGEEAKIPFTAEGVTVTGYDKNVTGQQTVTVTYDTVSTTFTVTVTPRMVAENYETKYFVGDTFNEKMGRIKVAGDDGKVKNVNLSDKAVKVDYDFSTAGKKTVTVTYTSGSASYTCEFNVTVYEAASVEYHAPQKPTYNSHKTAIEDKDVQDGYFTVTSADGTLTATVPVRADMIKGYNPSLATIDNRYDPLPQTLTVEYLGNTYEYSIGIYFSGVSVINYYAEGTLNGLNLSGKLTAAQKDAAYDALKELLKLTPADKMTLSDETVNKVASAASVGVMELFMSELNNYNRAFAMDSTGGLGIPNASTYAATVIALNDLLDAESEINAYVSALRQLVAEYGDVTVTKGETISDVVLVYTEEWETRLIDIFKHLTEVYDYLSAVENDWKKDTTEKTGEALRVHDRNISNAISRIKDAGYYQGGLGWLYTSVLSSWRTNNDLVEIIFSYAIYARDDTSEFMQSYLLGYFPLPGTLEDMYDQLMSTYEMQYTLYQNQYGDAWLTDLSKYATSYFLTLDLAEAVKSSGNQFWIDIYNICNMDYIIAAYTSAQNFGFAYHAGPMLDSEAFVTLWSQYYATLQLYLTNKLDAKTHEELICTLFDTFQSMDPNEVFGFLSSLNLNYGDARGSSAVLYLDLVEHYESNIFATILREYYATYLTEANLPIFVNLLLGIESAALFGENEATLGNFVSFMEAAKTAREALTDANDIANFEKYLGKSYYKYLDMYKRIMAEELEDKPTAEELALIAQLRADMTKYEEIYYFIVALGDDEFTDAHYFLLYTAYAKATVTYNKFMATASDAALTVFFTEGFVFFERSVTVGKAYYQIDKTTTSLMQSAAAIEKDGKYTVMSHIELLYDAKMLSIYADMFDLLNYTLVDDKATPDAELIAKLASNIAALDEFSTMLFNKFGAASVYYSEKCAYLESVLKDDANAAAVAASLVDVAKKYDEFCYNYTTESYLNAFLDAVAAVKPAYEALKGDAKTALSEIYNYYEEIAKELTPAT